MDDNTLTLTVDRDGVALIELFAGHFTGPLAVALDAAVDQVLTDSAIAGAVITGAAPDGFLLGARIDELLAGADAGLDASTIAALVAPVNRTLRRLETGGKPVAAAIGGDALGAGFELCLACHHRVLADDEAVQVGLPEVRAGLIPGGGGTQRLPRLVGIERALPLLTEGRALNPHAAFLLGLVDALRPRDDVVATARRWVLSQGPTEQPWDTKGYALPGGAGALAPHASASFGLGLARVRRDTGDREPAPLAVLAAVYEGTQLPMDRALALEAKFFGRLVADPVARDRMRALAQDNPEIR